MDYSTQDDFLYDIFESESEVRRCFEAHSSGVKIKDFRRLGNLGDSFYLTCSSIGWKSGLLFCLIVDGKPKGVLSFFSRCAYGVSGIYNFYMNLVLQQLIRFLAEQERLQEVLSLKETTKQLVPLMAVGRESTERMHDIRDEMSVIHNKLLMIENIEKYPLRGVAVKHAKQALVSLDRMREVMSKQLQTFKNSRERRKEFDLDDFLNSTCSRMRVTSGFEGVSVDVTGNAKNKKVRIQKFYMERVIENVVNNAIYYAKQNPRSSEFFVKIESRIEGGEGVVSIIDSGPGVLIEPIEKIFDIGISDKPDGYGIGLAISKTIMDEHEGKITVMKHPTYGAEFCLHIPLQN